MEKLSYKPDENGYSINFNQNEFLELEIPGGENRTRRDLIDPAHTVTLSFTCDPIKYAAIVKFVGDYVGRNCEPFLIDLQIYSDVYTEETVILIPNSFRLVSQNALIYNLSMEVEIIQINDPLTASPESLLFLFDFEDQDPGSIPIDRGGRNLVPTSVSWTDPGINNANAKFGSNSIFNSSAGWYVSDSNGSLAFGTGNWQIDWWSRCVNSSFVHSRVMMHMAGASDDGFKLTADGGIIRYLVGGIILGTSAVQSDNVYYHNALQRLDGVIRFWDTGVKMFEIEDAHSFPIDAIITFMSAKGDNSGNSSWNGQMDEIRGTRNLEDFFTGDIFVPPTAPYDRFV